MSLYSKFISNKEVDFSKKCVLLKNSRFRSAQAPVEAPTLMFLQ